jgi:hypothetical protein
MNSVTEKKQRRRSILTRDVLADIPVLVQQGLSIEAIAAGLGCSVGTLRVRCSQAQISLRGASSQAAKATKAEAVLCPQLSRVARGAVAMQANHAGGAAFVRAVREEFEPADFSVVVKRRGSPPKPWRWEIYCACTAVPIERSPVFFESAATAVKEGKKALTHLLAK